MGVVRHTFDHISKIRQILQTNMIFVEIEPVYLQIRLLTIRKVDYKFMIMVIMNRMQPLFRPSVVHNFVLLV